MTDIKALKCISLQKTVDSTKHLKIARACSVKVKSHVYNIYSVLLNVNTRTLLHELIDNSKS